MLRPDGRLAVGLLLAAAVVLSTLVMAATTGQPVSAITTPGGGSSTPVSPAIKTNTLAPDDQAASFAYYKALRTCLTRQYSYRNAGPVGTTVITISTKAPNSMSQQNAIDFDWFNGSIYNSSKLKTAPVNEINVGAFNDPRGINGDGRHNCGDSEGKAWIAKTAGLWGYSGPALLCELGFKRQNPDAACTSVTPPNATNDFIAPTVFAPLSSMTNPTPTTDALDALWQNTLGNGSLGIDSITPLGGAYRLYYNSLVSQCKLTKPGEGSLYKIQVFSPPSLTPTTLSYGQADRDIGPDHMVTIYDQKQLSCAELAKAIADPGSDVVKGYAAYLKEHGKDPGAKGTCAAGATVNPSGNPCPPPGNTTACAIDGIGWIVCPVITFLGKVADGMFGAVSDFLRVSTSVVNSDPAKGATTTYTAWRAMQAVANVILVIVFLIIIFSQISGLGLSNLGIKKMLPKLVVAAVLMNLSFILCQVAVDVSNILGVSIKGFFVGLAGEATKGSAHAIDVASGNVLGGTNGWANIAGGVLATVAIGLTGYFMISMLGTVLVAALLALLTIVLILIARQGLIVLAIVMAPIAIALWLLPNTKSVSELWWKVFSRLLLLFPIISLIFGASTLASVILRDSFGSFTVDNNNVNWLGQIMAAGIQVIPLFATPLVLKGALNMVPVLGNMASKFSGSTTKVRGGFTL